MTRAGHHAPATAAAEVQRSIESAAGRLRLETRHLPSGATHDAQMMATLMPMGMIFVPSIGGISHSPKELNSSSVVTSKPASCGHLKTGQLSSRQE
jgi:N-carbamoyl-L-amino-acid hydrolase